MKLEVLEVGTAEADEWRHVVSWVYRRRDPEPEDLLSEPGETRYLVRCDGEPAAACMVLDYTLARGERDVRCAGVAAVGTLPEFRRIGAADRLMSTLLETARAAGQSVSALYAFRESYYRRFGYETCGYRWQVKCPQHRLPAVVSDLRVRQVAPQDLGVLDPVYRSFIRARSGSHLRSPEDWQNRMGKKPPAVYVVGDAPEAYLWASMEDFWGELQVGEFAWSSRAGYEGGLALVRSLCSNQAAAVWNEPPDSPFAARFLDQGASVTVHRATMFRVNDVQAALRSICAVESAAFAVDVVDGQCPWNQGTWTVESSADGVETRIGGTAAFRISAPQLAQALMGQPSLAELAGLGLVEVWDSSGFEAACRLLPAKPTVCMEFF